MSFSLLTPDMILAAVESATDIQLTSLTSPLPSYINRVYELRAVDGTKYVVKFYRPNRWTKEAILDEHRFVSDCAAHEVPVVCPLVLKNKTTLDESNGILFALFPKRAGRQFEFTAENDWQRIGSLLGRVHLAGEKRPATARITIDPGSSTSADVEFLTTDIIPAASRERYRNTALRIIQSSTELFSEVDKIRIHGDFHRGNILDRLDEGLQVIDFDDMAMGPPVQDLWLLLPDRAAQSRYEIDQFLQGYERFRRFDRSSLRCIESLRAMRMIYFLAWCSRQVDDFVFKKNFPDWGSDKFWQKETADLQEQLGYILEA